MNRWLLSLIMSSLLGASVLSFADDLSVDQKLNPAQVLEHALRFETEPQVRIQVLESLQEVLPTNRRLQDYVYQVAINLIEDEQVRLAALRALSWLPSNRQHENFFRQIILNNSESDYLRAFAASASYLVVRGSTTHSNLMLTCLKDSRLADQLRAGCAFAVSHSGRQSEVVQAFVSLLQSPQISISLKEELLRSSSSFMVLSQFKNFLYNYITHTSTENSVRIAAMKLLRFSHGDSRSRTFVSHLVRSNDEQIRTAAYDSLRTQWSQEDVQWFRLTQWPGSQQRRDPL